MEGEPMNVLITGGAGFIGSYLAADLLARGDTVVVLDDLSTGRLENIRHLEGNKNLSLVAGSILEQELTEELIKGCDVVYHLAAAVGVKYVVDDPLKSIRINILGSENVLRSCARWRRKVFVASTSEVYGKGNGAPFKEADDLLMGPTSSLRWSYACSKALDEYMALAYFKKYRLPVVIGRFFNTCGPRQRGEYGMVIPRFVRNALLGRPLSVYGDGTQSRSFGFVGDAVNAVIALMETPAAEGQVFNIGRPEEVRIRDLAQKVIDLTLSTSKIEFMSYAEAYGESFEDIKWRVPDISKIYRLTGWQPKVDLEELLLKVIEYEKSVLPHSTVVEFERCSVAS
jgi:UDP-glucose 4-epimerase